MTDTRSVDWDSVVSLAANTKTAYRRALENIPAGTLGSVDSVVDQIHQMVAQEMSYSTINVAVSGWSWWIRHNGMAPVTTDTQVRQLLESVRRNTDTTQIQKHPLTIEMLGEAVLRVEHHQMLMLGLTTGLRGSELVGVKVEDIHQVRDKFVLRVRKAKTGSRTIPLSQRSVEVVTSRMQTMSRLGKESFLFPGRSNGHISRKTVERQCKSVAEQCGFDPADYASHSLRAGFICGALDKGAKFHEIMRVTGHKSEQMIWHYAMASATHSAIEL